MENKSNKIIVIAAIIGGLVILVASIMIVINVINGNKAQAPVVKPPISDGSNNGGNNGDGNGSGGNNGSGDNGGGTGGNGGTTTPPIDDSNSLADLALKYPGASNDELKKIQDLRNKYNKADDTTIVKKILDANDAASACLFLKYGKPNVTTILNADFNKYYLSLSGVGCLTNNQTQALETVLKAQNEKEMKRIKDRSYATASEVCRKKLQAGVDISDKRPLTLKFTEFNIGEYIPLPFYNLETKKEVDLDKSTIILKNACALQSINIVDKK